MLVLPGLICNSVGILFFVDYLSFKYSVLKFMNILQPSAKRTMNFNIDCLLCLSWDDAFLCPYGYPKDVKRLKYLSDSGIV